MGCVCMTEAESLFYNNMKLVPKFVKNFNSHKDVSIDESDLLQIGYQGLWDACNRFDSSKGFKFSTFAVSYIIGYVKRSLRDAHRIHISRNIQDVVTYIYRKGMALPLSSSDINELVSEGIYTREQLADCNNISVMSLDTPIQMEDNECDMNEIIPDNKSDFINQYTKKEIDEIIVYVLSLLPHVGSNCRSAISDWLYAKYNGEDITQEDLAKKYGVSQTQIHRYLKKLAKVSNSHQDEIIELFGY